MSRLLVHVEGETEETFVNEVLAPHLYDQGYSIVSARLIGNARQRDRRGGIRSWPSVRGDIIKHLREDPKCRSTTMVDYYGLPSTGTRAWPGRDHAATLPFEQRASVVEEAILDDVRGDLGGTALDRFIPFVMMHEFEGLLFSDCEKFSHAIGRPELAAGLQSIRGQFNSPEEINDSPLTCPSARVRELIPGYQKPHFGLLAVLEIGLDGIQRECPHFRDWLARLDLRR